VRLLFLGDIVGSAGRKAVGHWVPELRKELDLDYVIANGENAAGGRGITPSTADEIFASGVDVISGGNHMFQHRDAYPYLDETPGILRPHNYPPGAPGQGIARIGDLVVINLIGRAFMGGDFDDPFRAADAIFDSIPDDVFTLVDFHAEATSEKQALGWYLDGRATAVIGTHTHVPTADTRLLPKGTAFCTDAGMCGAIDSIIGVEVGAVLERFSTQMPNRFPAAEGPAAINGLLIDASGPHQATSIVRCDRGAA
jgi:2',3'-cyclic-nucleotide 2'-phosphodiesterase